MEARRSCGRSELEIDLPKQPNVFTKEGRVIGPGEAIEIPEPVQQTDYEGELAVAIGKRPGCFSRCSA
ncbi:MAG: fumarylacetoacetate hydrolase family protein [Terriglobia bacterium]